jgi:adenosine deaminase
LHSVPHAGEEAGPASIRGALDALLAERLGHGVRILEGADLVAEVKDRRIPLEVCPTSNVLLGVFPSFADHPLLRLLEAGLVVTLNSDVPAMIASPLEREYATAREVFGLDDRTLADIARAGVQASFLEQEARETLTRDVADWLDRA